MATPAMPPPPAPGGAPTPDPQGAGVASPAPPQQNPTQQQGLDMMVKISRGLMDVARMFPTAASSFAQIKPFLAEMTSAIMQESQPPEPVAPPQGG